MSSRIAYFINQYPKVSHSFIRREILALERQGFEVQRIALRGWDSELVDAEDLREREQTRYVLKDAGFGLISALLRCALVTPNRFFSALALALRMGRQADRPWPFHLIYLAEACRIQPWMKDFNASHVHAHFGTNSAEVVMLAHVLGGPAYSFTVHGPEEFDKPKFIGLGEKIRRSAFVVAISSYGRSQLYRWVEHDQWQKIQVVHCGLERAFHAVTPVPLPETPRMVCVGRICEQKGQLLLIEAAGRMAAKGIDFELVLAGDGEMRGEVEALIARHGIGQRVRITGWISADQVRDEILAARGLVLPSFAEGLPVVIMEAMALRRPVLTTFVAGIPELVMAGENGWLFPAGSVDALIEAMQAFLATPQATLARMGEAGYQRVRARHDIDIEAAKLVNLFRGSRP
ncbi:MAG: colanic acid biosynthesis glycosyltransferase WcaL [Hydrogenophilales bacterium 28-61-23]|nr:MAG: colanic acid biosynthesis glycosyltransferase WcaL [Hydrogenophilales bacterium 28-61-23]